jgi:hypothetical protein
MQSGIASGDAEQEKLLREVERIRRELVETEQSVEAIKNETAAVNASVAEATKQAVAAGSERVKEEEAKLQREWKREWQKELVRMRQELAVAEEVTNAKKGEANDAAQTHEDEKRALSAKLQGMRKELARVERTLEEKREETGDAEEILRLRRAQEEMSMRMEEMLEMGQKQRLLLQEKEKETQQEVARVREQYDRRLADELSTARETWKDFKKKDARLSLSPQKRGCGGGSNSTPSPAKSTTPPTEAGVGITKEQLTAFFDNRDGSALFEGSMPTEQELDDLLGDMSPVEVREILMDTFGEVPKQEKQEAEEAEQAASPSGGVGSGHAEGAGGVDSDEDKDQMIRLRDAQLVQLKQQMQLVAAANTKALAAKQAERTAAVEGALELHRAAMSAALAAKEAEHAVPGLMKLQEEVADILRDLGDLKHEIDRGC